MAMQLYDTATMAIAYNEWLNTIIAACENGDIYAHYTKDTNVAFYQMENRKGRLVSL